MSDLEYEELPERVQRGVWQYILPDGWRVLAGRTAADNEYLSVKFARANDWWFHVRGMPGSHVLLQVPAGADPDREALKQAAGIAAFHSKGREGGVVSVSATRAKNVSKPRGAKVGTVNIKREIVLKVRPGLI